MTASDADIFEQFRDGDGAAFEALVERYHPRLTRFAMQSFGDPALADDLVQETFVAVYTARASFDPSFAFSTWVWTILLNLCRRERRRRRTRNRTQAAASEGLRRRSLLCDHGLAGVDARDEAEHLRRWLDELPPPQADALRLRFFAELSFDEIAAAMDSSVSGAKNRVRKGLVALSAMMKVPGGRLAGETQIGEPVAGSPGNDM